MATNTEVQGLLAFANCAGCAGKLPVQAIAQVVQNLPRIEDPNLLIGADGFSDAGVYRIADNLAMVQTVDFFPPVVDDPFTYVQIPAANALSDAYAMGATPKTVLNIVGYPDDKLPLEPLQEILRGAAERVTAAGAATVGGHSLRDAEIKFGLAVTGLVDPDRMMTNRGARPGDVLILTKPLGTGFIMSANRKGKCPPDALASAVQGMVQLNGASAQAAVEHGAKAATDITGFSLAGHAGELAHSSGVTVRLRLADLPTLPAALDLAAAGYSSRANRSNAEYAGTFTRIEANDPARLPLIYDPQTSGGLLIAIAADRADALLAACQAAGAEGSSIVGDVFARQGETNVVVI